MALSGKKVRSLLEPLLFESGGYTYIKASDIKAATALILKEETNVYAMAKKDGPGRKFCVGNAKARVAHPLLEVYVFEDE